MITLALSYGVSFAAISKRYQEKAKEEVSSEEAREIGSCLPLTKQKIATIEKNSIRKRKKEKCISESCTEQEEKRQPGLVSSPTAIINMVWLLI